MQELSRMASHISVLHGLGVLVDYDSFDLIRVNCNYAVCATLGVRTGYIDVC